MNALPNLGCMTNTQDTQGARGVTRRNASRCDPTSTYPADTAATWPEDHVCKKEIIILPLSVSCIARSFCIHLATLLHSQRKKCNFFPEFIWRDS